MISAFLQPGSSYIKSVGRGKPKEVGHGGGFQDTVVRISRQILSATAHRSALPLILARHFGGVQPALDVNRLPLPSETIKRMVFLLSADSQRIYLLPRTVKGRKDRVGYPCCVK